MAHKNVTFILSIIISIVISSVLALVLLMLLPINPTEIYLGCMVGATVYIARSYIRTYRYS